MLPIQRQKQIKTLIQKERTLKISELSEQFGVSEMTIYRDVKPLLETGLVVKTFGGISLVEKHDHSIAALHQCVYCFKPNNPRLAYRLILEDNVIETACCAHCGLIRHRQLGNKVLQAVCHDFFMHTTVSAHLTWYVMNTSLNISCCQPQVLTFANKEDAEKFVIGFGGDIYSLWDAMETVHDKMKGSSKQCCDI